MLGTTVVLTACTEIKRGDSIVGKWECSSDRSAGWQIEYRQDNTYQVTFNSGISPWKGTYKRENFEITYRPEDHSQSNPYYLRTSLIAIDRNGAKAIAFDGNLGTCSRVGD